MLCRRPARADSPVARAPLRSRGVLSRENACKSIVYIKTHASRRAVESSHPPARRSGVSPCNRALSPELWLARWAPTTPASQVRPFAPRRFGGRRPIRSGRQAGRAGGQPPHDCCRVARITELRTRERARARARGGGRGIVRSLWQSNLGQGLRRNATMKMHRRDQSGADFRKK